MKHDEIHIAKYKFHIKISDIKVTKVKIVAEQKKFLKQNFKILIFEPYFY